MPERLAVVFPGQGSQYVGMGRDLYERYPEARAVFDAAEEILGLRLSRLCFAGPEQELNDTVNTQVAILTSSLATLGAMGGIASLEQTAFVAGHSLGEYTALVAAGAISFVDAVGLVRERGRLMKEVGRQRPGGMAAVLGLSAETVSSACRQARRETGAIVQVANYNLPEQIVISGEHKGLERAIQLTRERGARRVVPLAVSIASHSELMEPAARGLAVALESVTFEEPDIPVVANVTAKPLKDVPAIREELVKQIISPVEWVASVTYMFEQGVTTFVEVGPKDTLTKMTKRIVEQARAVSVSDAAGVETWRDGTTGHIAIGGASRGG